jgi:hypothetical protein
LVDWRPIRKSAAQFPSRYQWHRHYLARRRLRAQFAGCRHGDLLLPAGKSDANANGHANSYAHANGNGNGDADVHANGNANTYSKGDTEAAPDAASSSDASMTAGLVIGK